MPYPPRGSRQAVPRDLGRKERALRTNRLSVVPGTAGSSCLSSQTRSHLVTSVPHRGRVPLVSLTQPPMASSTLYAYRLSEWCSTAEGSTRIALSKRWLAAVSRAEARVTLGQEKSGGRASVQLASQRVDQLGVEDLERIAVIVNSVRVRNAPSQDSSGSTWGHPSWTSETSTGATMLSHIKDPRANCPTSPVDREEREVGLHIHCFLSGGGDVLEQVAMLHTCR